MMNTKLTGTKSIMHYLASSAGILIDRISAFEIYVAARLLDWDENPDRKALRRHLLKLDFSKEKLRDQDRLEIVRKTMQQHMVDIDALHQHIDINVHNLIAEKDRAIQFFIALKSDKDTFNMKIIAILTAFFLPGTFMAILFATPMFRWDHQPEDPLIINLPFQIYWATSGSLTFVFAFLLLLMSKPWILRAFINKIPFEVIRKPCQNSQWYKMANESVLRKEAFADEKKISSIQRKKTQRESKDSDDKLPNLQWGPRSRIPGENGKGDCIVEMDGGSSSYTS